MELPRAITLHTGLPHRLDCNLGQNNSAGLGRPADPAAATGPERTPSPGRGGEVSAAKAQDTLSRREGLGTNNENLVGHSVKVYIQE